MMGTRFSPRTLAFLKSAGRQKHPTWLERNRAEYEAALLEPLQNLARELKSELASSATGYHFPQKGIGRVKRSAPRAREHGGRLYKDWISYSAARPRKSRFEHNPNLYFMIDPSDAREGVLVAGGLYMPSSKQLRALREAVAADASAFERLFASKEFSRCFKGGFSAEKKSSRVPRGFDPAHPRIEWIKLQAFFVWRPYSKREFFSSRFPELVARDWRQILRLNELIDRALEQALSGRLPVSRSSAKKPALLDRLESFEAPAREMDF